jgi:fatty-acyl-CoA synthase
MLPRQIPSVSIEDAGRRLTAAPTPLALLRLSARARDVHPAIVSYRSASEPVARELSYGALLENVELLTSVLCSAGVNDGDGIAIFLPTIDEAVIAFLAGASVGIAFPLNPLLSTEALRAQLALAGTKVAIISAADWPGDARARFYAAAAGVPTLRKVIEVPRNAVPGATASWSGALNGDVSHSNEPGDPHRTAALYHCGCGRDARTP